MSETLDRTIVTKTASVLVMATKKRTLGTTTTASRCSDVSQWTAHVSKTSPFKLQGFGKFLRIQSENPIELLFHQAGTNDDEYKEPVNPIFTTGLIMAEDIQVGHTMQIALVDKDRVLGDNITVSVLNVGSGETERVVLNRVDEETFMGSLPTHPSADKGPSFDGVLYVQPDDQIDIQYTDPRSSSGESTVVVKRIKATSSFVKPEVLFRPHFLEGQRTLNLFVRNGTPNGVLRIEYASGLVDTIPVVAGDSELNLVAREQEGDVRFIYFYTDVLQISQTVEGTITDSATYLGQLKADTNPTIYDKIRVVLQDFDNVSERATVQFIHGEGSVVPVRCTQIGKTGHFEGELVIAPEYEGQCELTYSEMINGTLETSRLPITVQSINSTPTETDEPETKTTYVSSSMLVDGLFEIHGTFNGLIELVARDSIASVKCEVVVGN
jgi:hypothetical protein